MAGATDDDSDHDDSSILAALQKMVQKMKKHGKKKGTEASCSTKDESSNSTKRQVKRQESRSPPPSRKSRTSSPQSTKRSMSPRSRSRSPHPRRSMTQSPDPRRSKSSSQPPRSRSHKTPPPRRSTSTQSRSRSPRPRRGSRQRSYSNSLPSRNRRFKSRSHSPRSKRKRSRSPELRAKVQYVRDISPHTAFETARSTPYRQSTHGNWYDHRTAAEIREMEQKINNYEYELRLEIESSPCAQKLVRALTNELSSFEKESCIKYNFNQCMNALHFYANKHRKNYFCYSGSVKRYHYCLLCSRILNIYRQHTILGCPLRLSTMTRN